MAGNKPPTLSDSSSSSSLSHPSSSHGLRSQLGHILPKHATFHVRLVVEQLSNVPLVSGEFGVRWKFRNVHNGAGLLSKMKHRSVSSSASTLGGVKKIKVATPPEIAVQTESGTRVSFDTGTPDESNSSSMYGQFLTASPPDTPVPHSATPTLPKSATTATTGSDKRGEARGTTDWVPLKNYNAKWDHTVDVLVQMDIHRETGNLLPCELKLVAMQRVVHGDPNAPHQPRLGAVYLNLAEYACQGPVTRRYLLRDSKTNATLKLTIELEHVGGEKNFTPPPLRKGEIMASVTGILSNNDLYNTKIARNLDLYARPADEHWMADLDRVPPSMYQDSDGQIDFDRLASSDGLRTTENLIDAIFNPVPTTSEKPSPFTYYDPERALEVERAVEQQSIHGSIESANTELSSHASSIDSTASDDRSSGSSLPGMDSQKHWWQKMRSSRPSTPADRQFKFNPRHAASAPRLVS